MKIRSKFDIEGMTCSGCSSRLERKISGLRGMEKAEVNLLAKTMHVEYDEDVLGEGAIVEAVEAMGFSAARRTGQKTDVRTKYLTSGPTPDSGAGLRKMRSRLAVSFAFSIPLVYLAMAHMVGLPLPKVFHENFFVFSFTQILLVMPVAVVNWVYFTRGLKNLFDREPSMDSLVAIGAASAIAYSIYVMFAASIASASGMAGDIDPMSMDLYFESAAMILSLITLGKYLEERAKDHTSDAITKLIRLRPDTATVLRDGVEELVPVESIVPGDIVVIKPGQSIPVDGIIVEGRSTIDVSAITGESIPVDKQAGDHVWSATINQHGYFRFRAERVGDDTTLARIIALVEEASASKAPISRLADKLSAIFVPAVMLIAAATFVVWLLVGQDIGFALSMAITVLVISCPCALGLATPTAIMVGMGKGAQNGILFKSAEALEISHDVDTVVLDKTGTVTEGKPVVTDIIPLCDMDDNEFLTLAASLENMSEHPLSFAIKAEAEKSGLRLLPVEDFRALPGKGIEGTIQGKRYFAGGPILLRENGIDPTPLVESIQRLGMQGKIPFNFGGDGKVLGIIGVADTVKRGSHEAVADLKSMGLDVILLTGDNRFTAEGIRMAVGIDRVIPEMLPEGKSDVIKMLKAEGRKIVMIGDGINDAPALVAADIGVAIGAGTDIAIESADVVLMHSDLQDAVTALKLGKAVIRNIKENLFWALIYNTLGIPIAAGVFFAAFGLRLNPMIAAAAMSLSSISVVMNALRLNGFKREK